MSLKRDIRKSRYCRFVFLNTKGFIVVLSPASAQSSSGGKRKRLSDRRGDSLHLFPSWGQSSIRLSCNASYCFQFLNWIVEFEIDWIKSYSFESRDLDRNITVNKSLLYFIPIIKLRPLLIRFYEVFLIS